jgi:two-component system sensor histidine kinase QseC
MALVTVVSAVTVTAAWFSWREGRIEADELFDAKLAHSARVLASIADPRIDEANATDSGPVVVEVWHAIADGEGDALVSDGGHAYETRLAFQIRDDHGRLLLRSDSGPTGALAPLAAGFVDTRIDGEKWRVFTMRSARAHWVQAAERSDIREELAADIALGTMVPTALALPVLAVLVWLVVTRAARGLERISSQVARRAANSLEPLSIEGVREELPEELRVLVAAIDGLLARLRESLARERRFIADAAHELRTPLAALRVHAVNLASAPDAASRAHSQQRLEAGIARMERLVLQLLELERQEGLQGNPTQFSPVELCAIARREIAELGVAGLHRGIVIDLVAPTSMLIDGDEGGLGALLRNLVENALRYTPQDGAVSVRIAGVGKIVSLTVDDSGPGIAETDRQRAMERFHRGLGHATVGSGLGLSIVQRVVELHQGEIRLDQSPMGGLRVEVRLPGGGTSTRDPARPAGGGP